MLERRGTKVFSWSGFNNSSNYLKGVVFNGLDNVLKEDLGGQGVAMVDDRLSVRAVPDVQLHAAAAFG